MEGLRAERKGEEREGEKVGRGIKDEMAVRVIKLARCERRRISGGGERKGSKDERSFDPD